jgi:hypothetical protein
MMRGLARRPPGHGQPAPTTRAKTMNDHRAFLPSAAAALALLTMLAADGAIAADKSFGKGKPSGRLLTPVELRDCLDRQERVRAGTEETTRQQAKLAADKAEIDRLGVVLKEQIAVIDRKSASAVEAYNAQVETRDKMIDDYQEAVPGFNGKVEALKAEQAAFAKACENRRYDEADEIAVRKGK